MATCSNCSATLTPCRTYFGRCAACHSRWDRAGRPDGGPPPPQTPAWTPALHEAAIAARTRAYEDSLRVFGALVATGIPVKAAARRMGVAMSTAHRYAAVLRTRQEVAA